MRIGVDVGGTFTDVVMVDEKNGEWFSTKTPTTHHDLAEGVLRGISETLAKGGRVLGPDDYLIHGTTIGTNAIVEGKGARVGLITTAGFEDVLEIRRVARPKEAAFDFEVDNPPPLVPRYLRRGVKERVGSDGGVRTPLDEQSVRDCAEYLKSEGVEAIVVCLLFSFLNPAHERRVAEICKEIHPAALVSLSSEICPEFREYERTCTTVMNGYLGPVIKRYMMNLQQQLRRDYGDVRLHIMQSNGGSTGADVAADHAAHLINSGPAGGAMAAAFVAKSIGREKAIGADMGGTTFDISVIDKGVPKTTTWGGVTEYPIKLPMVDMKTIGAGGGSIAWVDEGGVLYVGPQSAGSDPGPACYGWGGMLPTVTDANLVLGRLNPDYFLGGALPLYPDKARTAVEEHVARPMGVSVDEAALSIIKIANANMAKGISAVSVERGYDLREFVLIPFGGAAANHAAAIARDLNMKTVVVPNLCGNLSALGLIVTDVVHDYVRTVGARAVETNPARLLERFREMESEGVAQVLQEHVREEDITLEWSADLRYEGQSWELNTPIKRTPSLGEQEMADIINAFHVLHKQAYSYSEASQPVEFINLRVKAIGRNPSVTLPRFEKRPEGFPLPTSKRNVMLEDQGWKHLPVYDRGHLVPGDQFEGPAIVEERLSITFLPPHSALRVDEFNNLIIDLVEVA
jgi:N-methylhydantoinase A